MAHTVSCYIIMHRGGVRKTQPVLQRACSDAPLISSRWLLIFWRMLSAGMMRQKGQRSLASGLSPGQPSGLCRLHSCARTGARDTLHTPSLHSLPTVLHLWAGTPIALTHLPSVLQQHHMRASLPGSTQPSRKRWAPTAHELQACRVAPGAQESGLYLAIAAAHVQVRPQHAAVLRQSLCVHHGSSSKA